MSVKMLKPYYVKEDEKFIRIVLAYQYFSMHIDGKLYQFVPLESREIIIDRKRQKVHNVYDIFVFQRGSKLIYVAITDLLQLGDFLTHLNSIVHPYFRKDMGYEEVSQKEMDNFFHSLERENLKRMIDQALDDGDKDRFKLLTDEWKLMSG
ncbi:uncharacterized protein YpiB (UPF0302 family) [Thalassobacillus pellis]|nr:IDEAL domain-containing protein [Thalassobacillus pellis]MBM7551450.1 uncharacterized protein YpiB (UPF0302 family) [Thalassobacillus pellis]